MYYTNHTQNPCELYPCDEGEVCLRKGWVYCLHRGGCRPSNLRVCGMSQTDTNLPLNINPFFAVNITQLSCEDTNSTATDEEEEVAQQVSTELGTGDVDPADTRVCGTDGNTYPAVCQLLQRATNINVRYAGRCNSSRCRGGLVSVRMLQT